MESNDLQRQHGKQVTHRFGIAIDQAHIRRVHRAMLAFALVGLFASIYLFITYVSGKPIACGVLQGCEIVRASKWAYTFGIPRPLLGVVFYLGIICLLAFHAYAPAFRPREWRLMLLAASTIGLIESGFLTLVQWLDIHAYCTWCVTSAVCATILFALSLFDGREPSAKGAIVSELKGMFAMMAASVVLGLVLLYVLLIQGAASVAR